jgi:hypothetical protein
VALRPRLSLGWLLSRRERHVRGLHQGCQAIERAALPGKKAGEGCRADLRLIRFESRPRAVTVAADRVYRARSTLASLRVRPAPGSPDGYAMGLLVRSTWGTSGLPRPACRAQRETAGAREHPLERDLPTSRAIRVGVVHGVRSAVVRVFRCLHPAAFRRRVQGRG